MFRLQTRRIVVSYAAVALLALAARPTLADQPGVVIDITKAGRSLYPIAVPTGDGAAEIAQIATFDLQVSGWFRVLDSRSFLADLKAEGLSIEPRAWSDVGAYGVMKYRVSDQGARVRVDFKLYEVEKGARPVLERSYTGTRAELRDITHKWCNEVVKYYTNEDGFFGSKIAFVEKTGRGAKAIKAMDFDGHGVYAISRNRSINVLPAWSPDGRSVVYTSYMRANPDLYLAPAGGGRPKRISNRPGMNTGGSWSPDGSQLAVTLSLDGNPEIYVISAKDGKIVRRLTKNRDIDTSPVWSPSGKEIAFVSNREGGPQIFVMNADGSNQRRVSRNGSYNTTPAWSPVKGTRVLAYTTLDSNYDIVTLDLDTEKYTRVTQNEGNNEEPSFSPNGRAIVFASRRSKKQGGNGVYIANADGTGEAVRVYSGAVTEVDWGPAPR